MEEGEGVAGSLVNFKATTKTGDTETAKISLREVSNHPAISAAISLLCCSAKLSRRGKAESPAFLPKGWKLQIIKKGGALLCF